MMRPVLANMCSYESLTVVGLDLVDFHRMNHALDAKIENENRYRKAND